MRVRETEIYLPMQFASEYCLVEERARFVATDSCGLDLTMVFYNNYLLHNHLNFHLNI